jgi:hypothetical protein
MGKGGITRCFGNKVCQRFEELQTVGIHKPNNYHKLSQLTFARFRNCSDTAL